MKRYNVECKLNGIEFDNYLGDYVTAETAEEAMEIAKDSLKEMTVQNGDAAYATYAETTEDAMDYAEWIEAESAKFDTCDYKVTDVESGEVERF